jgi:hypothetical protein
METRKRLHCSQQQKTDAALGAGLFEFYSKVELRSGLFAAFTRNGFGSNTPTRDR